jgi:hypothetical protein
MQLEGSCHCGSVRFSVNAPHPVPFLRCYCSICRKTAGGGGFAINLGADANTLKLLKGKRQLRVYRALLPSDTASTAPSETSSDTPSGAAAGDDQAKPKHSTAQRNFCARCGSALWLWDPQWPELIHPHAGAIDTPLPEPPEHVHMMLGSKANWAAVEGRDGDARFDAYPDFSLAEWHERRGLTSKA